MFWLDAADAAVAATYNIGADFLAGPFRGHLGAVAAFFSDLQSV